MPQSKKHLPATRKRLLLIPVLLGCIGLGYVVFKGHAASPNVIVNFSQPVVTLDPYAFSGTISTYSTNGSGIIDSSKQRTELGNLKLGLYRVPLQWNGGNIVSSAGGHPGGSGDAWVNNIIAYGGTPMIVVGGSSDNNFSASDAANLVNHFNGTNGPKVNYWVVGNEPGNGGMDMPTYCNLFNSTYDAMKKVRTDIKIAGPAWAFYDQGTLQNFLNCAGSRVDIIDYHHYGMGGTALDTATALSQTGSWETEVNQIRQMINATVPARASQIGIQVGEYNWSWRTGDGWNGYNGDDRFYQAINTVWGASVAGHIAKAGGHGNQYSDQNGGLGITFQEPADASHYGRAVDDPMPIYYGLEMFSGGNLFRHFGAQMVQADSQIAGTEVFASTNSDNVVLINKDPSATQSATIQLNGIIGGTADVWQTSKDAPFAAPTKKGTITISSGIATVSLPPYSVTTLVTYPSGTATPTPTTTPSPTPAPVGDINGDGKIDVFDLSQLLSNWGTDYAAADLNHDGTVNVFDLSALLSHWSG